MLNTKQHKQIIVRGDFNITLDPLDASKNRTIKADEEHRANTLSKIIKKHKLIDNYREKHPLGRDTTFASNHHHTTSRLDKFFSTENITTSTIKHLDTTLHYTDHKGVYIQYDQPTKRQGQGSAYWKFNNSLLENTHYTQYITEIINSYIADIPETEDLLEWWDTLKKTIKNISIYTGKVIQQKIRIKEKKYINILSTMPQEDKNNPYLQKIRKKLDTIINNRNKGHKIRCTHKLRTNTNEEIYHNIKQLEVDIQGRRTIKNIKDMSGNNTNDTTEILKAFEQLYTLLYTKDNTNTDIQAEYTKHAKKLTEGEKIQLDT